jgi:hypothetical protein
VLGHVGPLRHVDHQRPRAVAEAGRGVPQGLAGHVLQLEALQAHGHGAVVPPVVLQEVPDNLGRDDVPARRREAEGNTETVSRSHTQIRPSHDTHGGPHSKRVSREPNSVILIDHRPRAPDVLRAAVDPLAESHAHTLVLVVQDRTPRVACRTDSWGKQALLRLALSDASKALSAHGLQKPMMRPRRWCLPPRPGARTCVDGGVDLDGDQPRHHAAREADLLAAPDVDMGRASGRRESLGGSPQAGRHAHTLAHGYTHTSDSPLL